MVKAIPRERVLERIMEQIARSVLVDRIKDRIAEQCVDALVPQMRREIVEVVQPVPVERIKDESLIRWWTFQCLRSWRESWQQERVQQRIDEQIVEVLIPQITEDSRRVQNGTSGRNFRKASVNRWWTSPFQKLTRTKLPARLKLFSFKFARRDVLRQGKVFDEET